MKESHVKGPATHDGPESCGASREESVEALTGVRAGRVFSRERTFLRDADAVRRSGRPHRTHRHREMRSGPARSETPCTYGNISHENREVVQRCLAAILAGESPVGGDGPVDTVVISGGGEGDRTVESPEVKASAREASNSAGCSESESVCLEMVDIGSGRAVGTSRRRSAR
jgi:RNA-directed DNA polymerase